jgi:hypothetical protein
MPSIVIYATGDRWTETLLPKLVNIVDCHTGTRPE